MGQRIVAKAGRRQAGMSRMKKQNVQTSHPENVLAIQLSVCLLLFFAVFLGNGIFPERMIQVRQQMQILLTESIDFQASFEALGESLPEEREGLSDVYAFCADVLGFSKGEVNEVPKQMIPSGKDVVKNEIIRLSESTTPAEQSEFYLGAAYGALSLTREQIQPAELVAEEPEVLAEVDSVPAAGTVLLEMEYTGRELPQNYTMNQLSLGDLETVTPVLGHLNSEYGYRDHPINGVYQFHGGVDIGGQKGDPIVAFADGKVAYIGEDKSYGLYLQIDHGNGVKSFYAHCNKLFVSKGDTVKMGERIAEVGSSGSATGPHLHLELKYQQMHLNPAYYLEFLSA